ncbi:MAG TPA: prepilin peptidase [Stellaceae bacterium]|nr:prepilin peptidase [Stellaceae bacterium]
MPYAAHLIDWLAVLALLAALIAAAISDAITFLIPNRYSAAIGVAFAVYAFGKPLELWLHGLEAAALLLAVGVLLFDRGILGGGDVKLMTAIALWTGFDALPLMLVVTGFAGGALALAHLSPLHRLMPARPGAAPGGDDLRSRLRRPIPFGVAIALGGVCIALTHVSAA